MSHEQGLRRRAEPHRRCASWRRAGTTPTRPTRTASPRLHDRSIQALALRRVEGRRRRDGAGVRPLLRHADLLPARRLPDRARTTRGVELHGFLSYLVKCNLEGREYSVFGYKGKQVRDNIHSLDVARFMDAFVRRAAQRRGLQPRRRQGEHLLDPRSVQIAEQLTGRRRRSHLRRSEPHRRPHLLLLAICARCVRTIRRGTSRSRSRRRSRKSSTRGRYGGCRPHRCRRR